MRDSRMGREVILANLSAFHPDYGMSPEEHAAQKIKRAAGSVAFIPKAQLRAHRSKLR